MTNKKYNFLIYAIPTAGTLLFIATDQLMTLAIQYLLIAVIVLVTLWFTLHFGLCPKCGAHLAHDGAIRDHKSRYICRRCKTLLPRWK